MRGIFYIILLTLLFTQVSAFTLESAKEYEIKAVYLFNVGNFVRWTPNSLQAGKAFQICIAGQDPFGADLDYVVKTQKEIQEHPVIVNRLANSTQFTDCHILFVSSSEQLQLPNILNKVKNQPILTVGDSEHFVTQGGMVQFYRNNGKIRLMLDPQTIKESGLKASAQLLQIGLRVD